METCIPIAFSVALATGIFSVLVAQAESADNGNKASEGTPVQSIKTRIGELKYQNDYPTKETVEKLYDEIDFQRACQAYLWGLPLVSAASVRRGLFQDIGATYNDFEMYPKYSRCDRPVAHGEHHHHLLSGHH